MFSPVRVFHVFSEMTLLSPETGTYSVLQCFPSSAIISVSPPNPNERYSNSPQFFRDSPYSPASDSTVSLSGIAWSAR